MDDNKSQSVISNEVEITGTIRSSGSLQIDGKLEGELHCGGDAVIGKSANIKGNLAVNSATIEGEIDGEIALDVGRLADDGKSANIKGNLAVNSATIEGEI